MGVCPSCVFLSKKVFRLNIFIQFIWVLSALFFIMELLNATADCHASALESFAVPLYSSFMKGWIFSEHQFQLKRKSFTQARRGNARKSLVARKVKQTTPAFVPLPPLCRKSIHESHWGNSRQWFLEKGSRDPFSHTKLGGALHVIVGNLPELQSGPLEDVDEKTTSPPCLPIIEQTIHQRSPPTRHPVGQWRMNHVYPKIHTSGAQHVQDQVVSPAINQLLDQ